MLPWAWLVLFVSRVESCIRDMIIFDVVEEGALLLSHLQVSFRVVDESEADYR
jgi:hypothetical protein